MCPDISCNLQEGLLRIHRIQTINFLAVGLKLMGHHGSRGEWMWLTSCSQTEIEINGNSLGF